MVSDKEMKEAVAGVVQDHIDVYQITKRLRTLGVEVENVKVNDNTSLNSTILVRTQHSGNHYYTVKISEVM